MSAGIKNKVHTRNFENVWTPRACRYGVCQFHVVKADHKSSRYYFGRITYLTRVLRHVMLLCVQPSCTSMARTKSVTKGVMRKRVLYDTLKTQVKNISHSALPQKYPLKTMLPRHPPAFFSPRPRVHLFIVVLLR